MMHLPQWRVLRDGDADLVLTVAFDPGRGNANFSDLARCLGGRRVLEAVPRRTTVAALRDEGVDGYVAPWLEAVKEHGKPVKAVLGHCGGDSLARELAIGVRAWGLGEPSLMTFDPLVVDGSVLVEEYRVAVGALVAQLTPRDLEPALAAAESHDPASTAGGSDLLSLAETLERAYRTAAAAACRNVSVAPAVQQQLCDRFSAYLTYLAAAARARSAHPSAHAPIATTVLSATADAGPRTADPCGTITRFAVGPDRLLGDPEVAAHVSRALSG
ncbi:hypothetical protein ACIBCC_30635 [Streptomyces griseus]|uniref:hypothetical protein n=1 Tax=Streptomyces griseus TaxID=1911 RepID=UPI0004C480B1|nr:hypothetical protein [Streptomyces griseus]